MVCDCIKLTHVAFAFSGSQRLNPNANKLADNILVNFLIVPSSSSYNKTIITFYLTILFNSALNCIFALGSKLST